MGRRRPGSFVFHPMSALTLSATTVGSESVVLDVVRWGRMFDRRHQGPFEQPPRAGPLDGRPGATDGEAKSRSATSTWSSPGGRAADRSTVPVRLHRGEPCGDRAGWRTAGSPATTCATAPSRCSTSVSAPGQNEAVFVPVTRHRRDDGWVLCLTYGADTRHEPAGGTPRPGPHRRPQPPRCTAVRVPFGFHGTGFPDSERRRVRTFDRRVAGELSGA